MALLTAAASRFVGRDKQLAQLRALLAEARLVTLCGPPGIGKTRTAHLEARVFCREQRARRARRRVAIDTNQAGVRPEPRQHRTTVPASTERGVDVGTRMIVH